jgi:O-antigen ligase
VALAEDEVAEPFARQGEWSRRLALGLLASLVTARAYWPSEVDPSRVAGSGLIWVLALLIVAGLAILGSLLGGRLFYRWSWTDAAVVALMCLVGLSARRGLDYRLAVNLGWDWAGLGIAYLLARNLPRTRGESTALAGALVATAVAVSVYGLYQARVEIPQLQQEFRVNAEQVLRKAHFPADTQGIKAFTDRVLGSNEVFATFGLANSLAGFLVGPLVLVLAVILHNLGATDSSGSRWRAIALAAAPLLCMLLCLMLTKSRSAAIGLVIGVVVLAWGMRRRLSRRLLLTAGLVGIGLLGSVVAFGAWTGRLDREVLTQSARSMSYRWEYWRGAWGVISAGASSPLQALAAPTFWSGVGPGNFGGRYLLYKLPQASEEIQDPHNLILEVWATAGIAAVLALLAALGLAMFNLIRQPCAVSTADFQEDSPVSSAPRRSTRVPRETHAVFSEEAAGAIPPPRSQGWLILAAALGLVMVLFVGEMNLFQNDLFARWLVLTAGWVSAVVCGHALWRRCPLPPLGFGTAALASVINLLAAGGISYPGVALCLWLLIALGLNLSEGRTCGALRENAGRAPTVVVACLWAALAGTFVGTVSPYWQSEAAVARADQALRRLPPDFEKAQAAYEFAKQADRFNPRPWLGDAYLQLLVWESRGSKPADQRWRMIPTLLLKAASAPRNPDTWVLHRERAEVTRDLLKKVGTNLAPRDIIALQASVVEATRTASRLYPTNATLHARLAEASAEISMFGDAVTEAEEALRLDALMPHPDKKLTEATREHLRTRLPQWKQQSAPLKVELK